MNKVEEQLRKTPKSAWGLCTDTHVHTQGQAYTHRRRTKTHAKINNKMLFVKRATEVMSSTY